MATLPRRVTASLSIATLDAPRPPTGVRDLPDPGPNNEEPAKDLDTAESITDSAEATDGLCRLGLGKPQS